MTYLYLETGPDNGTYRHRGAVGPGDEPESFAGFMARGGLRIFLASEEIGEQVDRRVLRMLRATDPSVRIVFIGPLGEHGIAGNPLLIQALRRTKTPDSGAFVEGTVRPKGWFTRLRETFA